MQSVSTRKRKTQRNDVALPLGFDAPSEEPIERTSSKAYKRQVNNNFLTRRKIHHGTTSRDRLFALLSCCMTLAIVCICIVIMVDEIWTHWSTSGFPQTKTQVASIPLDQAHIAVVSLHQGFKYYGSLGRFLRNNKLSYAAAHGYAYTDVLPAPPKHMFPLAPWQQQDHRYLYYAKPQFLLYLMEHYPNNLQWLLWMDGDAIFTDTAIKIEDRIEEFQRWHHPTTQGDTTTTTTDLCLVWAKDAAPNAGILLLHNSPTTRALLQTALTTYEDTQEFRLFTDQASLTAAIQGNTTFQQCTLLLENQQSESLSLPSSTLLQSRVRGPASGRWQPGHWILHLPNHNRWELLASLKGVGTRLKKSSLPALWTPLAMPPLELLPKKRQMRFKAVQLAIRHAWTGYTCTCVPLLCQGGGGGNEPQQGHHIGSSRLAQHIPVDDLAPLTHSGHDWLHHAATLYDSLDTLFLAGLQEEYNAAVDFVLYQDLQATALQPTKTFEYSLRIVGGLLGAFSVTGDERLLSRAKDAVDALFQSPFSSSPTVLPRMYDVLFPPRGGGFGSFIYQLYSRVYQWGRDVFTQEHHFNSLAGVGSFALEFYFLSHVLGVEDYKERAKGIFQHVAQHAGPDGIVPGYWNVMTGLPIGKRGGMGSGSDSFYEYLLKVPLAGCTTKDKDTALSFEKDSALEEMLLLYKTVVKGGLRSKHVFRTQSETVQGNHSIAYPVEHGEFHHLLCFLPGMLALGAANLNEENDDMLLAADLLEGCRDLYERTPTGLGPEQISVQSIHSDRQQQPPAGGDRSYLLRPEYVESLFVLYRLTHDEKYQEMGWRVFENLERYCKTDTGYAGLQDVYRTTKGRVDDMPSFFTAETLKYLLLLFGSDDYVSLDDFVFTTEAHPLRRFGKNPSSRSIANHVGTLTMNHTVSAPFPWMLGLLLLFLVIFTMMIFALMVRSSRGRRRRDDRRRKRL